MREYATNKTGMNWYRQLFINTAVGFLALIGTLVSTGIVYASSERTEPSEPTKILYDDGPWHNPYCRGSNGQWDGYHDGCHAGYQDGCQRREIPYPNNCRNNVSIIVVPAPCYTPPPVCIEPSKKYSEHQTLYPDRALKRCR